MLLLQQFSLYFGTKRNSALFQSNRNVVSTIMVLLVWQETESFFSFRTAVVRWDGNFLSPYLPDRWGLNHSSFWGIIVGNIPLRQQCQRLPPLGIVGSWLRVLLKPLAVPRGSSSASTLCLEAKASQSSDGKIDSLQSARDYALSVCLHRKLITTFRYF